MIISKLFVPTKKGEESSYKLARLVVQTSKKKDIMVTENQFVHSPSHIVWIWNHAMPSQGRRYQSINQSINVSGKI